MSLNLDQVRKPEPDGLSDAQLAEFDRQMAEAIYGDSDRQRRLDAADRAREFSRES
jgi:hypothetical protein